MEGSNGVKCLTSAGGKRGGEEGMGFCGEAELFEGVDKVVRYCIPRSVGEEL